jgi:poly(3-hydroxybutyrate) depolymerase
MNRIAALFVFVLLLALPAQHTLGAQAAGELLDETVPSGANYDKADFRLWYPADAARCAIVVLMPGSNGDGRPMAEELAWQAFASKNKLALVGGGSRTSRTTEFHRRVRECVQGRARRC